MSVLSFIRRGRQAAKEHSAKQAEKDKKAAEKIPYKHVPTHAAVDALSGAPATWRDDDRPRILEQHKRRSAMTASGIGMGSSGMMTPVHAGMGMPRVNSALSHVSYPSVYANPVVKVPRAYSYSSMPQGWSDRGGEVVYTPMDHPASISVKGKGVDRPTMIDSGRASRTSSKADSPVGSSGESTSSQDDLEMPTKHASINRVADSRSARVVSSDQPHRLHPSRRVSDPPAMAVHTPQTQPRSTYYPPSSSAIRPAVSRTTTAPTPTTGVPPVPTLPPMHFGRTSRPNSAGSGQMLASYGLPQAMTAPAAVADIDPAYVAEPFPDYDSMPRAISDEGPPPVGMAISTPPREHRPQQRVSKAMRFSAIDSVDYSTPYPSALVTDAPAQPAKEPAEARIRMTALPTEFHEADFTPAQTPVAPAAPPKNNRLSKSHGGKLTKKNRWSIRGSKPSPVAV